MNRSIPGYNSTGGVTTLERYSDVVYSNGSQIIEGYANLKSDNLFGSGLFD